MHEYGIIIHWSHDDDAYVAEVPELPGCIAHGNTYESAVANANEAIQLWIDTAKEYGDPVPGRKGHWIATPQALYLTARGERP